MGKESLWNLSRMIKNTLYKKIVVIHGKNLSSTIGYRERAQLEKFKIFFQENNIDNRVIFEEVISENDLISIKKLESNILIRNEPVKEALVKLQYLQRFLSS